MVVFFDVSKDVDGVAVRSRPLAELVFSPDATFDLNDDHFVRPCKVRLPFASDAFSELELLCRPGKVVGPKVEQKVILPFTVVC